MIAARENEGLIAARGTGTPFTVCGTDRLFCLQLLLNFLLISCLFILVPIIGIFGGAVVPLYKGMMSQTVDPDERGQFFLYYRASCLLTNAQCPL